MQEIKLAQGLTEGAIRMCRPCIRRNINCSCMITGVSVEEQNALAASGLCNHASLGEGASSPRRLGPYGWENTNIPESQANS